METWGGRGKYPCSHLLLIGFCCQALALRRGFWIDEKALPKANKKLNGTESQRTPILRFFRGPLKTMGETWVRFLGTKANWIYELDS